jgi:predicted ATPase
LSFNEATVELGALNVLIGPNAVGKSNLIEVIGLLQAAPSSLSAAILRGGGVRQLLWLGDLVPSPVAMIGCQIELTGDQHATTIGYCLRFSEDAKGFKILGEQIAKADQKSGREESYLERSNTGVEFGHAVAKLFLPSPLAMIVPAGESVLSQFKNPADPTPTTELGRQFSRIRIFREFRTGPLSGARLGVSTSVSKESLVDGGDNLALVLHELDFLGVHGKIRSYLQRFCERFDDVKVNVGEGLARTFLKEAGLAEMLSAIRMSDGTLKFLSLLAALFNPNPPPLICIEEPELGLHPDALQLVAEALVEASESTQLIVTTHSDALVDALTDRPESVLVCERDFDNGTQMKRLSKVDLKDWLERYTLGQLWRKGEIGGGRW